MKQSVECRDATEKGPARVTLEFTCDGAPPPLVEDQYGAKWMLISPWDGRPFYKRVACIQATLVIALNTRSKS